MESSGVSETAKPSDDVNANVKETVVDPISSKIDDIHCISQVIKSLRWKPTNSSAENRACSCGDAECIEVCDIREWLPTANLEPELWTMVLSLGETYLALGKCYVDDHQFHQALELVELAWTLVYNYGSKSNDPVGSNPDGTPLTSVCFLPTYIFLANAWTLAGETYAHFNMQDVQEKKHPILKLKMLTGGDKQRQSSDERSLCYLMNCCCLVDRADSESSAYASASDRCNVPRNKKGFGRRGRDGGDVGRNSEPGTSNSKTRPTPTPRTSNIFKFLSGLPCQREDSEYTLLAALLCYEEARSIIGECPDGSTNMGVVLMKKTGWAFNELGRTRLLKQEFEKAETAFHDAMTSFRQVSDHATMARIYCNLGYARQASARMLVPLEPESKHRGCIHEVESAKIDFRESLKYYVAAMMEVAAVVDGDEAEESSTDSLRIEVCTQLGHAHLRFGMLLAREDTKAEVDFNCFLTNKGKSGKREVSAEDVIGEAISLFESLGEQGKEEAALGYKELAKFHLNACLKLSEPPKNRKKKKVSQQHMSLAQKNWQKSVEVYGADSHPMMYLRLLIDVANFGLTMSDQLRSNEVPEDAFDLLVDTFDILLNARLISVGELVDGKEIKVEDAFICDKFWRRLQSVSKKMLFLLTKSPPSTVEQILSRNPSKNAQLLENVYRKTLIPFKLGQLLDIHQLWVS